MTLGDVYMSRGVKLNSSFTQLLHVISVRIHVTLWRKRGWGEFVLSDEDLWCYFLKSDILKNIHFYFHVCKCNLCLQCPEGVGPTWNQSYRRLLGHHVSAGNQPRSPARAAIDLNHWAVSSAEWVTPNLHQIWYIYISSMSFLLFNHCPVVPSIQVPLN